MRALDRRCPAAKARARSSSTALSLAVQPTRDNYPQDQLILGSFTNRLAFVACGAIVVVLFATSSTG